MITFEHDTGKAQAAIRAAERRKLPVPQEIRNVAAMVDIVRASAQMRPPERPTVDDVPATVAELGALLEERARARRVADSHREEGSAFLEPIGRRFNALVADEVPRWIRMLAPEFNNLVKQLRTLARKLPADLDKHRLDWNNPSISTPWARAEGIALQLDQLVHDRTDMAKGGGLLGEGGRDSELYQVARLPEPTTLGVVQHLMRDHVSPERARWRELRHDPVRRWIHLVRSEHLTIELATPSEVRERAAVWDRWRDAIAARGVAPVPGPNAIRAIEEVLRG